MFEGNNCDSWALWLMQQLIRYPGIYQWLYNFFGRGFFPNNLQEGGSKHAEGSLLKTQDDQSRIQPAPATTTTGTVNPAGSENTPRQPQMDPKSVSFLNSGKQQITSPTLQMGLMTGNANGLTNSAGGSIIIQRLREPNSMIGKHMGDGSNQKASATKSSYRNSGEQVIKGDTVQIGISDGHLNGVINKGNLTISEEALTIGLSNCMDDGRNANPSQPNSSYSNSGNQIIDGKTAQIGIFAGNFNGMINEGTFQYA